MFNIAVGSFKMCVFVKVGMVKEEVTTEEIINFNLLKVDYKFFSVISKVFASSFLKFRCPFSSSSS